MENSGKIKIGSKEYNVFLEEINNSNSTTTTTTPVEELPVDTSLGIIIVTPRYDSESKQFVASLSRLGKSPSEISWDGVKYYPFSVIRQEANKATTYWVKINNIPYKIEIKTADIHSTPVIVNFNSTGDNPIIEEETTPVVDSTTPPVVVPENTARPQVNPLTGFAEIGKKYHVFQKTRLHLSSYVAGDKGQYVSVKKDGVTLFEMNTYDGQIQDPKEITMGNHHVASILPVDEGDIDFYFENTSKEGAHVVGLIKDFKMAYEQYNRNGLQYAEAWKRLEEGQSWNYTFNIKHNRGGFIKDGKFEIFFPVFKDGKLLINKQILFNGSQHGLGNTFVNQYSKNTIHVAILNEPSVSIDVEVETFGLNDTPNIKVVTKNGLDIHPNHVIVDAYYREYYKEFNNHCSGYKSQPEHEENQV